MITGDEAINPDQETPSSAANRLRLFYPRGQTATVLAWIDNGPGGTWQTATAAANVDNGFTQFRKRSDGNYENPTDRTNAPGCIVLGLQS